MPITPIDPNRGIRLDSPLGDKVVCHAFNGNEELSGMFFYELQLRSLDRNISFTEIVGKPVTLTLDLPDGTERYFHGFVTEFRYTGSVGQFASYEASIRPRLWFLTRKADCRIFQKQKVPDIIKEVFGEHGMSDFKDQLSDTYRKWDYCVQYRETDFNFVSRLMEQEGIYYYFQHEKGKHTLVLCDGVNAHQTFPGYATVPYYPPDAADAIRKRDHIQDWNKVQSIMPGKYAIDDYDFTKPKVDLMVKLKRDRPHAYPIDNPEIYDYPGEYFEKSDGDAYIEKRLQELQCQHERAQAFGDARGMCAGYLFTLENYPRDEENKQYLITSVTHSAQLDALETGSGEATDKFYRCSLELLDSAEPYRPERRTPKPVIQGNHSAEVVGPKNEEIYCDEYGRVKVQFHWDRLGKKDENSSCWLRISSLWAGTEWGGIHIPRIGQEVLVGFMEGDPDQPYVSGRMYNATHMPPYELPSNKTQSGIKSRSSPGGSAKNFNELRFEDKKGKEEVYFQAEKNLNSLVKNNETRKVRNRRTTNVGTSRSTIGEVIEKSTVHADRGTLIKGNDYLDVAEDPTSADGRKVVVHFGDHKLEVPMGEQEMKTLMDHKTRSDIGDITRDAPTGKISDEALMSIELKVGPSSIKLTPAGIKLKGPKMEIDGGMITIIKGGMVKIN